MSSKVICSVLHTLSKHCLNSVVIPQLHFQSCCLLYQASGTIDCRELIIDTFIGELLSPAGSSPSKIVFFEGVNHSKWLTHIGYKGSDLLLQFRTTLKIHQALKLLIWPAEASVATKSQVSFSLCLIPAFLTSYKHISCKHFLINSLHAILHLRLYFQGTQIKTNIIIYENDIHVLEPQIWIW